MNNKKRQTATQLFVGVQMLKIVVNRIGEFAWRL